MTEDIKKSVVKKIKGISSKLNKNKYLIIMILVGAVFLMWPSGKNNEVEILPEEKEEKVVFDLDTQEEKLKKILSEVEGAGNVNVMLTLKSTSERILAKDKELSDQEQDGGSEYTLTEKIVTVSGGASNDDVVTIKYIYPEYLGAIVVAEGADKAAVKLALTNAAAAATGLSSNKIQVIKMK